MRSVDASKINKSVKTNAVRFISESNNKYRSKLISTARGIKEDIKEKPIVLLSGPSGSGKTTTAYRLSDELALMGIKSHIISMDNYFIPNTKIDELNVPRDSSGNVDLESPYRIDICLFQNHLHRLFEGETVEIPIFDFVNQDYSGHVPVLRKENEVIIIEGIHALNPEVTGNVSDIASCIYVSVRTRLKTSDGDLLHPSYVRLMRRLIRDSLFRGRSYDEIFAMFASVQRGENLYIMPYKNRADYDIDTFIDYEASVYKGIIYEKLLNSEKNVHSDIKRAMIRYLAELLPVDASLVPPESLIKEFIG